MKHRYQTLMVFLMSLFVFACFDNTEKVKADLENLKSVMESSSNLDEITRLQQELLSVDSAEKRAVIFYQIADQYTLINESLGKLDIQTAEVKQLKDQYTDGFNHFVELMKSSAQYSITPPTEEQAQAFVQLQKDAVEKLTVASNNQENLKKEIETKSTNK